MAVEDQNDMSARVQAGRAMLDRFYLQQQPVLHGPSIAEPEVALDEDLLDGISKTASVERAEETVATKITPIVMQNNM